MRNTLSVCHGPLVARRAPFLGVAIGSKMRKMRIIRAARPAPEPPLDEDPVLDPDFDDVDEVILFEPPILATRRVGGHLTRLDDEREDE